MWSRPKPWLKTRPLNEINLLLHFRDPFFRITTSWFLRISTNRTIRPRNQETWFFDKDQVKRERDCFARILYGRRGNDWEKIKGAGIHLCSFTGEYFLGNIRKAGFRRWRWNRRYVPRTGSFRLSSVLWPSARRIEKEISFKRRQLNELPHKHRGFTKIMGDEMRYQKVAHYEWVRCYERVSYEVTRLVIRDGNAQRLNYELWVQCVLRKNRKKRS